MKRIKVGLALGSGAARGMAHIGVISELEKAGIPIDMVVGSSMGAVVGGLYCSGLKLNYMERVSREIDRNMERHFYDLSLPPAMGLLKGQRIEKLIRTLCGNRKIEDLKRPFQATACCVETAELVSFDHGDLTQAIRASMSIPGIFEPVIIDGKTYVDSGFMQRVPVEVLRHWGADYIIGVDVGYRGGPNGKPGSMLDLLFMYYDMVEWRVAQFRMKDASHMITVDTRQVSPANFYQAPECIDLGRQEVLRHIPVIIEELTALGLDPSVFKENKALAQIPPAAAQGAGEGEGVEVGSAPVDRP